MAVQLSKLWFSCFSSWSGFTERKMYWLLLCIKIHLKWSKCISWTSNIAYCYVCCKDSVYTIYSLCFPLFSSISHILSYHGPWISSHLLNSHPAPKSFDNISYSTSNISLTCSVINIFHSESLSEPIRLVSEDLRARGKVPGVWCQTCQLKPTPQSASHLNKCRQPELRVPKSMEHGEVNMQTATSSNKLEEVVYERLGRGLRRRRC